MQCSSYTCLSSDFPGRPALTGLLGLLAFSGAASGQCEVATVQASDAANGDRYARDVAISGDVCVVGSERDDDTASNSGSAYVYRFDGASWVQEAKLVHGNPDSNDHYGQSVEIDGDVIVIGAPDDDDLASNAGSVWIYRHDGATWNHEQTLTAFDFISSHRFGWNIGVSGDVIAVSAKGDDDVQSGSGAVYVYRRLAGTWTFEQKVKASDLILNQQFGDALALDGTRMLVGAWQDDDAGTFSGSAYVFDFNGASWGESQKLTASDAAQFNWFGRSVALSGDLALVGAYEGDGLAGDSGAAYIYRATAGVFAQEAKLIASDGASNDRFGWSVALCDGGALVGAYQHGGGSIYQFAPSGTTWTESGQLVGSNTMAGDQFALAIDADGDRITAGAQFNDEGIADAGSAYIFSQGAECGVGTNSCSGDGGDQMGCTDCPCGNEASPGTIGGCLNSAATSTELRARGTASISAADLRIEASGAPPLNSCQLTSGNALAPANMANPCFGLNSGIQSIALDGLRCAVQQVLRHGVRPSDANGEVGVTTNGWGAPNGFFNFGAFSAGQTKHFQIIHRDDAGAVCMTGQNTSQAMSVTFGS